ncbi:MAG: M56 family metallopeptidase [Christiangramia sp.]|uniref:M56 family metallopeptidase n=1 Tax=Christiangramia sp. TaxID=1931228 RepID=UPI0032428FAA
MENLLIYLLKSAGILAIFFLLYQLLLRKETSFETNRFFLLGGMITAAILPGIYFTKTVFIQASKPVFTNFTEFPVENVPLEASFDWWQFAGQLYLGITALFLVRFLIQLASVLKLIYGQRIEKHGDYSYIQVSKNKLPFSFFRYIVFDPSNHPVRDLQLILAHEEAHARQYHSADILIANILKCVLWFNPFSWLYQKAIEQNLEYLADREAVASEENIKAYQHALVKVSVANLQPALTNHFYQSFIKKRILMLNKKSSDSNPGWKISLVAPLLLAFMLIFNVKTEAKILNHAEKAPVISATSTEVTITSATTRDELKEIEQTLKEYDVEVHFQDLNFADGKLTSLSVEYKNLKNGASGNMKSFDKNGINPFVLYISENGEIGTRQLKSPARVQQIAVQEPKTETKLGEDPLYVVNGKTFTAKKLRGKYIALQSAFQILNPEKAVSRYGRKAANGAVVVPNGSIIRDMNKEMKKLQNEERYSRNYISIDDQGKPNLMNLDKNHTENSLAIFNTDENTPINIQGKAGNVLFVSSQSQDDPLKPITVQGKATPGDSVYLKSSKTVYWNSDSGKKGTRYIVRNSNDTVAPVYLRISQNNQNVVAYQTGNSTSEAVSGNVQIGQHTNNKPLYIIDGVIVKDSEINEMEPSEIAAINVLKGEKATTKYGKKAEDGAIEIHTKGSGYQVKTGASNAVVFGLQKTDTDSKLEELKISINESTGLEVSFSNIQRNADGEITGISVSAKKDDQKASASYSNSNGIPDIMIGFSDKKGIFIRNR